ncbi:MAG: alpha/beta hydrolase [Bacteroidota bacterium]
MKKLKYLGLFGMLISIAACSDDDEGLSGTLYVDDVYNEVATTFDIQYGANAALVGNVGPLFLDVYEPVGDGNSMRPTIVLAHGGAFVSGTKTSIRTICEAYALKGYTVASIQYRLINDPNLLTAGDSIQFSEGVVLTLGDMKAAIRYLRNDALNGENQFNIDSDLMFAGGISAGAIMANHIGYLDEDDDAIPEYLLDHINTHGGFEGNTNNIQVSSEVAGIVSFSGSLFRDKWINEGDVPIFMVHEEGDEIVPCNYEASGVFPFDILAYGSCELETRLVNENVSYQYVFYPGVNNHVGYFSDFEMQGKELIDLSATFLENIINP